jgi:hypothetical protein
MVPSWHLPLTPLTTLDPAFAREHRERALHLRWRDMGQLL